jgi:hypothetical protein
MARDHIEGVHADRAGRAKYGDTCRSVHGQRTPVFNSVRGARTNVVSFINPAT